MTNDKRMTARASKTSDGRKVLRFSRDGEQVREVELLATERWTLASLDRFARALLRDWAEKNERTTVEKTGRFTWAASYSATRSKAERERDRAEILDLLASEGKLATQEIARKLGKDPAWTATDLRALERAGKVRSEVRKFYTTARTGRHFGGAVAMRRTTREWSAS